MKKLLSFLLVIIIGFGVYNYISENSTILMTTGTDTERIEDTLSKFTEYYNNGEFDNLVKCHTKRMQSNLKGQMNIGSSLFSKILSLFTSGILDLGDGVFESIWSLGTNYCQMKLEIIDIKFLSDSEAEVKLNYIELNNGNRKTRVYLSMKKENNAWCVASDFYEHSKA